MVILYALLVLLAAVLFTTITSLYDLTIQLFNHQLIDALKTMSSWLNYNSLIAS